MIVTPPRTPRGSVVFVVLWALALAAIVVSSVQLFGFRQATLGRTALGRVQARWAARGGVEYSIATMAYHTEQPVADDAFALIRDLELVAKGDYELNGESISAYDIRHHYDGRDFSGPMDEHAKININATQSDPSLLIAFVDMTPDIIDALLDWMDDDDDPLPQGAEKYYYQGIQSIPYEPRNGPFRTVAEMELVAGIWPETLRGEDWNLNNRLDANEDDGERTWPADESDEVLQYGWGGFLTTHSRRGGPAESGLPRVVMTDTTIEEIMERMQLDEQTATAVFTYGRSQSNGPGGLLAAYATGAQSTGNSRSTSSTGGGGGSNNATLGTVDNPGNAGNAGNQDTSNSTPVLSGSELRDVLAEGVFGGPTSEIPGQINLNTVSEELLRMLFFTRPHLVDEILYLRSRPQGIPSLVDLADIPAFQDDTASLEQIVRIMDVSSNVYKIVSRGRSWGTGVEVEIIAVVDRSTLPVRILEYQER